MKTKIKKASLISIAIAAILFLSISWQTTFANEYHKKCVEVTQFYDNELDIFKTGDFNDAQLEAIKQECPNDNHHFAFPGSHIANIDPETHQPANESYHQPWTNHYHKYINHSEQEQANGKYLYKLSAIDTFEITLQQDLIDHVNLNNVVCLGLPDNNNCVGEGSLGKNDDNKELHFILSFDKNNGIIRWNFPGWSAAHPDWAKPNVYGSNPNLDTLTGLNTVNEKNRTKEFAVNFMTENVQAEAWSGTTTSRILIKDFIATMPPGTEPEKNDWVAFPHTPALPGEFGDYYWFPIGTVTTIWEKPSNVCESLTLGPVGTEDDGDNNSQTIKINENAQGFKTTIGGKTAYKMPAVSIVFSNEIPQGTKIRWTTLDAAGKFYSNTNGAEIAKVANQQYIDVNKDQTIYYVGNGPIWVLLAPTAGNSSVPDACNKLIEIPKTTNTCQSLAPQNYTLTDANKVNMGGNFGTAYRLPDYTVTYAPQNVIPEGTQLIYIAHDPAGEFYTPVTIYMDAEYGGDPIYGVQPDINTYFKLEATVSASGTVSITVPIDEEILYKGKGPIGLAITGPNVGAGDQKICQASIQVPGEACEELKVDHPKDIYVGTTSRFNAQAYQSDDTKFGDQVTYWVDHGYGLFYTTKPQNIPDNPSSTVYETFTYQGGSVWNYWNLDAYSTVPGSALSIGTNTNLNIVSNSIANGSFFGGYGEGEDQQGTTAPPINPIDFGGASVANAFTMIDTTKPVIMEPLIIEDDIYTINPNVIDFTATDFTYILPDYPLDLSYLYESITVPQGTPVYFVALKPGLKKVHAKALSSDVGDCERDFDIKEFNVCKEIDVNHPEHIYEKTLSEFSAAALNPLGNSFYGKVTYSVDAGYGQFYTTAPTGLQENDSNKVTEFDNSKPIAAPQGGFCSGEQIKDVPAKEPPVKNPADDTGTGGMTLPPNGGIGDITINSGNTTLPGYTLGTLNPEITVDIMTNPTNYQSLILEKYSQELFFEVPESFGTGIKPIPGPGPDPVEMGNPAYLNSVVHAFTLTEKEVTIDKIDLVTGIVPPSNGKTTLTVDPGTKVYFWAEKAGTNVVHVSANCTDEKNCKRDFSIEAKALTCKEAKLTAHNFNLAQDNSPTCLAKDGNYGFTATFKDDKGAEIPSNKIKVKWTTTDPNGKFESISPVIWHEDMIEANAFIGLSSVKYTGAGQVTAQLYELDGKKYTQDNCKVAIGPCPEANACASLQITSNPADPLTIGQSATLTLTSKDLVNVALPAATQVTWTTDTEGTLKPTAIGGAQPVGNQSTYTGLIGESVTFESSKKEGKVNVTMTNPADPLYSASCKDDISVIKQVELPVCTGLGLEITNNGVPVQTIESGKLYKLKSTSSYSLAVQNPTSDYSTTQGMLFNKGEAWLATLMANKPISSAEAAVLQGIKKDLHKIPDNEEVYLLTFIDAQGQDVLTIKATDRTEPICTKKFSIIIQQTPCQIIKVTYYPQPFDPAKDTVISVDKGDFGDFKGNFKFSTTGSTSGKFYTLLTAGGESAHENQKEFSQAEAKKGIIFTGGQKGDKINIEAVGTLKGDNCKDIISAVEEKPKCLNLSIVTPEGKWTKKDFEDDYDEGEGDKTADQKFKIEVTTDPAGFANNLEYKWEVESSEDLEFDKTTTKKSNDSNPLINYLSDFDPEKNIHVEIYAKDWKNECNDTATLNVEEKEDLPEIEKLVYEYSKKNNQDGKWTDTINVGGKAAIGNNWKNPKDEVITYLAIFDPGSSKSVEIWDSALKNGKIYSDINQGTLELQNMAIAVEGDGNKKYVIYKTLGFNTSKYSNEELNEEDKISEFDNFDDEDFETLADFGKEYSCDKASNNDVCLDYEYKDEDDHEFDKVFEDFQKGGKENGSIKFKHTDKADKIYIVYQMENNTKITDGFCKDMIEDFEVCGEQFDNEINFQAYTDDEFDENKKLEKGKDTATVIAICPFILAREGGDVFFHDSIDTGIDVSACYDVETCEGPCIKPKKEKEEELEDTGDTGEGQQEVQLIAPTHDVCKLSNTENVENLDAYKNVFENFSSSVCEMETEVAKDWKEKYINEAITANVEKLARFGAVTGNIPIETAQNSMSNGVVVINGDMTIGDENSSGSENEVKIGKDDNRKIPAAQTYIIKNGNLIINENVKYDDSSISGEDFLNPKNIPSVAFIVIDGNIEISPDVTELDGIYMAVDTTGEEDGEINPTPDPLDPSDPDKFASTEENILTIRGSLIGDVFHLFENRSAIGDPLKDESSITVKYDERILLNTPPGLTELIDINQLKVAN